MCRHVGEPAHPAVRVEVPVPPPGVPVVGATAPHGLAHMVVQVQVDLILVQLVRNGIKHLEPSRAGIEPRVLRENLRQHRCAIRLAQSPRERRPQINVLPTVVIYLVHHLNRIRQAHAVHPRALDSRHDGLERLVLQPLRHHGLAVRRPVCPGIRDGLSGCILDVRARGHQGREGPGIGGTSRGGWAQKAEEGVHSN